MNHLPFCPFFKFRIQLFTHSFVYRSRVSMFVESDPIYFLKMGEEGKWGIGNGRAEGKYENDAEMVEG